MAFLFNDGKTQITARPTIKEIKTTDKDVNRAEGLKTIKAIIPIPIVIRSLIDDRQYISRDFSVFIEDAFRENNTSMILMRNIETRAIIIQDVYCPKAIISQIPVLRVIKTAIPPSLV